MEGPIPIQPTSSTGGQPRDSQAMSPAPLGFVVFVPFTLSVSERLTWISPCHRSPPLCTYQPHNWAVCNNPNHSPGAVTSPLSLLCSTSSREEQWPSTWAGNMPIREAITVPSGVGENIPFADPSFSLLFVSSPNRRYPQTAHNTSGSSLAAAHTSPAIVFD